jgi:hypothetical protein
MHVSSSSYQCILLLISVLTLYGTLAGSKDVSSSSYEEEDTCIYGVYGVYMLTLYGTLAGSKDGF